jgi:diguanylate cyclase (GGDEF)-like protein/PAS domain S-box-containing protein
VLSAPWQTGQLYLNIGIPKAVVASEINRTLSYTLSGLAAAGGLTLLAVWAAGRRLLLQPVHRLIATAARLGGGDLGARSELTSHRSELGQLAQTLDAMAAALQLREGELQRTNAALKATEEETRHAKELLDRLFCNTNVLFAYLDRDFNFIRVNCAYARADGRTPDHFPGKNHFDLFPSDENHAIFRRVVETGEPYETYAKPFEYAHAPERGMTYWDWSLHPVKDAAGRVTGLVLGVINATERIKAEERVRFLQRYDELTGLPKLGALSERLREAIHDALKDGRQVAVLCLDIDRFKYINDQRGQVMGDRLLAAVAQRLTGCVRRGDVVARLTGDEFAVVLADLAQREDLLAVLRKLTACVDKTFGVDGEEYRLTCSVGVTLCPLDGSDPKQLLGNAEAAMYRAKEQGGNNVQFYSAEISAVAADYLQTYTALGRALERGELLLHYQPQVDAKSGRINAVEALLRWRHPEQGLVSPARFIPLAEETGLIVPIGAWVLNKACADARDWIEAGFPVRVAVNLSARQFHEPALLDTLRRALADSRLPRGLLELEFTESALMHDSAATREFLREAKALGVQFALDDFGTGYSSLSYLKRFPLDTLKIDRSFVSNIATHSDDAAIATAIIAMAHNLDKQVVAEGVETGAQLEFLRRHGCDSVQGYYFSRPVPAADFAQMLRAGKRLEPARDPAVAG